MRTLLNKYNRQNPQNQINGPLIFSSTKKNPPVFFTNVSNFLATFLLVFFFFFLFETKQFLDNQPFTLLQPIWCGSVQEMIFCLHCNERIITNIANTERKKKRKTDPFCRDQFKH